jgi:hypothetical protein
VGAIILGAFESMTGGRATNSFVSCGMKEAARKIVPKD